MGLQRVRHNLETEAKIDFSVQNAYNDENLLGVSHKGWPLITHCTYWHFRMMALKSKVAKVSGWYCSLRTSLSRGSVQFSSVAQSCLTLCDPMNRSAPGFSLRHQLSEFTQTHVHRVSDAIQPSLPLSSPSPPAPNLSQHQSHTVTWSNYVSDSLSKQVNSASFEYCC